MMQSANFDMTKKTLKSAFTLIELLVVIAIIALLLAILIPSLQKAKEQVYTVICKSNLRQWGLCFKMYADDNNNLFMQDWTGGSRTKKEDMWPTALSPYYGDVAKIRCCPVATTISEDLVGSHDYPGGKRFAWKWVLHGRKVVIVPMEVMG